MTYWSPDELDRISAAEELQITTSRPDGSLRPWVPIWAVQLDGALVVRSYRGTDGTWWRHATQLGRARVRAGGVERDVTAGQPHDTAGDAIDAAYRTKYSRYAGSYLDPMLTDQARAATLRLMPIDSDRRTQHMTDSTEPSGAKKAFGDFAPAFVGFTDDVLFGQVWERTELTPKERSLITVASLLTSGSTEQLVYHLGLAKDNGATEGELIEAITHLAFYAGWPKAMSAMAVAKKVFTTG